MKHTIAILCSGNFLIGTGAFVVAGLTSHIAADLNITIAAAAQLLTVYTLTYALTSPILVTFATRYRLKPALAAALAVYSIGNILVGIAVSFEGLCAARVVTALGAGLFSPLAYAFAANLSTPDKRTRALSLVVMGLTIANVIGLPLGTAAGTTVGWRWAFIGVGGLGFATVLAITVLVPNWGRDTPRSIATLGKALANRVLLATIAVSLLQYAALFVVFAYISPIVAAGGAFGALGVPWLLLLFGCGSVVGNLVGGWAADRWGKAPVITTALSLLLPILALFPIACHSVVAASFCAVLCGMAGLAFMAPQQHRVISIPGQTAAVALSLNVSAIYLGGSAGAVLGGFVANLGAYAFGLTGALLAAMALLLSMAVTHLKTEGSGIRTGIAGSFRA